MMEQTPLEHHMEVLGRTVAKFVSVGLIPQTIDSRAAEAFLGVPEDEVVFAAVLTWMLDEGIIRAKNTAHRIRGPIHISGAQLTAKGLAMVKQPIGDGDTIEKRVSTASSSGGSSMFASIGELIGGFAKGIAG